MTVRRFPYSDFLRGPSKVLPALDNADVVLERRDDDDLVLSRAERFDATRSGMAVATRALIALVKHDRSLAENILTEQLPWLHWLPPDERDDCVKDLLAHLAAGAETDSLMPFARALAAWRSTAEVWSDPELAERLNTEFVGDGPTIERPQHTA